MRGKKEIEGAEFVRNPDLASRLRSAFPADPPEGELEVTPGYYWISPDAPEIFAGRRWTEMDAEALSEDPFAIHYLSPRRKRYFLPAFLVAMAAERDDEAGAIYDTAEALFTPPDEDEPPGAWAGAEEFSPEQRRVFCDFYRWMKERFWMDEGVGDSEREEALNRFWSGI